MSESHSSSSDRTTQGLRFDETPLPEDLTRWTGFLLAQASALSGELYTHALAPLGLTPQHLGILTLLAHEGPLMQARIADRLHLFKPVVVGLLNDLEAQGLVQRQPHPTDKRAHHVHLLDAGKQRVRDAEQISAATSRAVFSVLSPDERRLLHDLLQRLVEHTTHHLAQDHGEGKGQP